MLKKNSMLFMVLREKGLSQDWLGTKIGIRQQNISLHINGRYNFTPEEEESIANALEMKREDLFE